MKQPETKFKERVLNDLAQLDYCWVLKTQEKARRGTPDILACIRGDFVAIELKTTRGVVARLQEHTLDLIRNCGGVAFVATPDTWARQLGTLSVLSGFPFDRAPKPHTSLSQ